MICAKPNSLLSNILLCGVSLNSKYSSVTFFVYKFLVNFQFFLFFVKFKLSVLKNFQFRLHDFRFSNLRKSIFGTSVKFNFGKFDRVDLHKNIADNGSGIGVVADY